MSALVLLGVGIVMIVAEIFFGSFFFIFYWHWAVHHLCD